VNFSRRGGLMQINNEAEKYPFLQVEFEVIFYSNLKYTHLTILGHEMLMKYYFNSIIENNRYHPN
jgi:hypothetical protein